MKRVVAKCVQQLLLPEQKEHHAAVANDFIQTATNEPYFFKEIITRDEVQVYSYQKQRLNYPNGSCLVHALRRHGKLKENMLTVFLIGKVVSIRSMPSRPNN